VRQHFHALGQWRGAGLDEPAALAEDLDGADAARAPRAKQRLIAEVWDLDPIDPGCFENERSLRDSDLLVVDLAGDHLGFGRCHHLGETPPYAGTR
jgi:hypothetical protein